MPSISQQTYLRIPLRPGLGPGEDAALLAKLRRAIELGTFFDVLIDGAGRLGGKPGFGRTLSFALDGAPRVSVIDPDEGQPIGLPIPYTCEQYEGLAAIQEAGTQPDIIPRLYYTSTEETPPSSGFLGAYVTDGDEVYWLTDEEGRYYLAKFEGSNPFSIVDIQRPDPSLTLGTEKYVLSVPFAEVQKLVGLPISEY